MKKIELKLFLTLLALSFSAFAQSAGPQIQTKSGTVEGMENGPVQSFLGIPYAQPPIGDLRWKPPVPVAKWTGIRKATQFGSRCMQNPVFGDMVFRDPGQSEDCLSLNIWRQTKPASPKLPVMVWIYGGGFAAGSTSEGRQDGTNLAQQGVVVVSMNYRLGIFGFLVLRELAAESGQNAAGNYGLLDQQTALQWVHDNIAAFGGDPDNVTIFGESAGSFSVSAQMASPLSKGLFQKAIGESGAAFFSSGLPFETASSREEKDAKVVEAALGKHTLAELRAIPAQKVLESYYKPGGGSQFSPDVDGYFLPDSPPAIFAAGKQNDVFLMAGWNRDEGSFAVAFSPQKPTLASLKERAQKNFGDKAPEFLRLYAAENDEQARRAIEDYESDQFIAWSTWRWMEGQLATGKKPVYRYRFDMVPPSAPGFPDLGAFHSAEIEYVFGQLDSKTNTKWRDSDRALSEQMQKYWANFARSGDPNGTGLPNWPAYSPKDGYQVMYLGEKSAARKDDLRDRYVFLGKAWTK